MLHIYISNSSAVIYLHRGNIAWKVRYLCEGKDINWMNVVRHQYAFIYYIDIFYLHRELSFVFNLYFLGIRTHATTDESYVFVSCPAILSDCYIRIRR